MNSVKLLQRNAIRCVYVAFTHCNHYCGRKIHQERTAVNMLLKVYSIIILMVDLTWVVLNSVYATLHTVYEFFRPPPLKSLSKETVLVVGAGRGVGRELALQVGQLGAHVVCVDINPATNQKTAADITSAGGRAACYECDVTKKLNVSNVALRIKNDVGFVSMVFHCCGIPSPRSLLTEPPHDIHHTLDLTLTSYFWLIDIFLPEMKTRNHGHIIALTSVAGLSYVKHQLPLSVAQFAVQGLAESLVEDLRVSRKNKVHVSLVHIYPFIVSSDASSDIRLRIPSYFGTITPAAAARDIVRVVRRNCVEASVPAHLLYLGHLLRVLPRRATLLIRELLDTGVDFA